MVFKYFEILNSPKIILGLQSALEGIITRSNCQVATVRDYYKSLYSAAAEDDFLPCPKGLILRLVICKNGQLHMPNYKKHL